MAETIEAALTRLRRDGFEHFLSLGRFEQLCRDEGQRWRADGRRSGVAARGGTKAGSASSRTRTRTGTSRLAGFTAWSGDPILIGQIQLVDVPNTSKAKRILETKKDEVINLANTNPALSWCC